MTRRNGRQLAGEDGLTLIELVIGAAIAIVIVGAIAVGMINNNDSALATQRQAQLLGVLQNRIEYVRQLLTEKGFSAVALSQNPVEGIDKTLPAGPTDPNDFISPYVPGYSGGGAEGFLIEKNYNNTSEGTIFTEPLQVDTTSGKIAPLIYVDLNKGTSYSSSSEIPSGDPYAIVNTFVTVVKEASSSSSTNCPTTYGTGSNANDTRRVVVAARLVNPPSQPELGSAVPQYSTTLIANPVPSNQCQAATGLKIGIGPIG